MKVSNEILREVNTKESTKEQTVEHWKILVLLEKQAADKLKDYMGHLLLVIPWLSHCLSIEHRVHFMT